MVMSVAAWPLLETVSEARALTAAAAHRSLPYLEVSSTKTARRGGQGRGEGRGEERGWMDDEDFPPTLETRSASGWEMNVGH